MALRRVDPSLQRCDLPSGVLQDNPLCHRLSKQSYKGDMALGGWAGWGRLGINRYLWKRPPPRLYWGRDHVAGTLGSASRKPPVAFSPARVAVLQEVHPSCRAAQSPRRSSALPHLCVKPARLRLARLPARPWAAAGTGDDIRASSAARRLQAVACSHSDPVLRK